MREIVVALRMTLATLVLTGIAYPLLVTALAGAAMPWRAAGSLVEVEGRIVGSELIGQGFRDPAYFHPRPSAAGAGGYDATASSGSHLGPTSNALRDRIASEIARLRADNPNAAGSVPADLVTASASGLDPHLSREAALWQVARVAKARGAAVGEVEALVEARLEGPELWIFGEWRVNVLRLNLDLDRRFGRPRVPA